MMTWYQIAFVGATYIIMLVLHWCTANQRDAARADRDVAESRLAEVEAAIEAGCPWYDPEYAWCKRSDGVAECLPCYVQGNNGDVWRRKAEWLAGECAHAHARFDKAMGLVPEVADWEPDYWLDAADTATKEDE